jgi:hypothetical protein
MILYMKCFQCDKERITPVLLSYHVQRRQNKKDQEELLIGMLRSLRVKCRAHK